MNDRYHGVGADLEQAYDNMVEERDASETQGWKADTRQAFLDLLHAEGKANLLEVGAGTGVHGVFFMQAGLHVTSTDRSAAMAEACRKKGLTAYQMDFLSLDFPDASFDAVYALNCLLHVPRDDLDQVLMALHRVLKPGGLFYWGQYGGEQFEGVFEDDHYEPKRFFSMMKDDDIRSTGARHFETVRFDVIDLNRDFEHFQSGTWRKEEGGNQ